jgi:hypothetical protein
VEIDRDQPLMRLDPVDSIYIDGAIAAASRPENGASIHSPLGWRNHTPPDAPVPLSVPSLAVTISCIVQDDAVITVTWVGTEDAMRTWRITEAGTDFSMPVALDEICTVAGEQIAGDWPVGHANAVPTSVLIFDALVLDGDEVVAGAREVVVASAEQSPDVVASRLANCATALMTAPINQCVHLTATDENGETWAAKGDARVIERLDLIRSERVVEFTVEAGPERVLVATGPAGTAVIIEVDEHAAQAHCSTRGAIAEVMAAVTHAGFALRPGSRDFKVLSELPDTEDVREMRLGVLADQTSGGVVLEEMLLCEGPWGGYIVPRLDQDASSTRIVPASPRNVRGVVASALRRALSGGV